jgi:hypothetical protein
MSAEEAGATTKVVAVDATATTTTENNGGATNETKNGSEKRINGGKKNEVPIEELFDLSKPIPRVRSLYCILFCSFVYCSLSMWGYNDVP